MLTAPSVIVLHAVHLEQTGAGWVLSVLQDGDHAEISSRHPSRGLSPALCVVFLSS